ncbi:MAG: hypothetical protein ACI4WV_01420 [Eubacteriales bacterium]
MVRIDFSDGGGRIKPLHGVGQPPFYGLDFSRFHYLTEAGIPYSRLHDVGGTLGGGLFVDIPNLFRDFDADPADPAAYDFAFTDRLITALVEAGVEPFFRLGVSIENDRRVKVYRIDPPEDDLKWARICEGVIRHYTEGWADGFTYTIRYWEIWNEPEGHPDPLVNEMWTGTAQRFYRLYGTAATYLKARFPHLKIGGYGSCGFYGALGQPPEAFGMSRERMEYFHTFFDGFLAYIKENRCPLDFFSWHSYASIRDTETFAVYARRHLDEAGYTDTETVCDEWNCAPATRGTAHHAALCAGMLAAMQQMPLDSAMFYDARFGVSMYGGMFNPLTGQPFPAYYAFYAFNTLYRLGQEVAVITDTADPDGAGEGSLYLLAARGPAPADSAQGTAGLRGGVLVVNPTDRACPLSLTAEGRLLSCHVVDGTRTWEEIALPDRIGPDSFLLIEYAL